MPSRTSATRPPIPCTSDTFLKPRQTERLVQSTWPLILRIRRHLCSIRAKSTLFTATWIQFELSEKSGGLNRAVQHHLILGVVFMRQGRRYGLSAAEKADIWHRWKVGESLHEIGRAFGKDHGSIQFLLSQRGGIIPPARRRSPRTLTLAEREDISRG